MQLMFQQITNINYTGNIIEDEEKNATVILEGTNATPYTNVRIDVIISNITEEKEVNT